MTRQDDHFEEFAQSDAFIEALMLGDDPSAGNDPLAAALREPVSYTRLTLPTILRV